MPQGIVPDIATLKDGPDLQGFREAQERLNVALGTTVVFQVPVAKQWPPGTKLDAQTGQPFDPTIKPVGGGGYTEFEVNATVAEPQVQDSSSDVDTGPSGVRRDETPVFIVMETDFALIQDATRVLWHGQPYAITEIQPDGIPTVFRYLVFTEAT